MDALLHGRLQGARLSQFASQDDVLIAKPPDSCEQTFNSFAKSLNFFFHNEMLGKPAHRVKRWMMRYTDA